MGQAVAQRFHATEELLTLAAGSQAQVDADVFLFEQDLGLVAELQALAERDLLTSAQTLGL